MNDLWWGLLICVVVVLGAALPLVQRGPQVPLPPRRDTLRDWRNDAGEDRHE